MPSRSYPYAPSRRFNAFGLLVGCGVALIAALVAFCVVDGFSGHRGAVRQGTVLERQYVAAHYTTDSDNKATWHPDAWKVIVLVDGDALALDVTSRQWASAEKGQTVRVSPWEGGLSGATYMWRIENDGSSY